MTKSTGLILGGALLIAVLVYVLTREPEKVTQGPSTSNDVLGGLSGVISGIGGLIKLIPRSASGNPGNPSPGEGGSYDQSQPNNPDLSYAPFYPGNDISGTGITDGGT